ncbi:MAG: BadF/BadG/BcrA/BcrD ATPase family protein [Thermoproteota archaeon]
MILVGIDGGATRTRAIAYHLELGAVWTGEAGPSNPVNVGVTTAALNIRAAVEEALRRGGLPIGDVALAVAGLAGLDSRLILKQVEPHIASSSGLGQRLVLEHDAHVAWLHATRGREGVLVIAGTGSIAYSAHGGRRIVVGNRGWLVGDEGSGFWLARMALSRLARALDGRSPHSCLTKGLMQRLSVRNGDELAYWFFLTRGRVDRIASVAVHVLELADEGCEDAAELVRQGAELLAESACIAARASGSRTIYVVGSMFKSTTFREAFANQVEAQGLRLSLSRVYPVLGALYIALKKAGVESPWSIAGSEKLEEVARKLYGT